LLLLWAAGDDLPERREFTAAQARAEARAGDNTYSVAEWRDGGGRRPRVSPT